MAVVVPGPAGGENEVSGMHRNALARDLGVGAFALDDETQRIGRVPVRGRDLAGLDHLKPAIERVGDIAVMGSPGFSNMKTRRSASLAVISSTARSNYGRM